MREGGTKHNQVEQRALAAITTATDLLIFLLDPSESCGYIFGDQVELYESLRSQVRRPLLPVWSKSDLVTQAVIPEGFLDDAPKISITANTGIDQLIQRIQQMLESAEGEEE